MVRVPAWREYGWLRHGFSTRAGGVSTVYGDRSLNLGWTEEDDPARVTENRRRLQEVVADGSTLVTPRQVHGTEVHVVQGADCGAPLEGDGLATDLPGVLLGIQTADCVPVMLLDPTHRAVAVLHAGWRGTAAGMVDQGVARMREVYGSKPETMQAAIGPAIGPCCYTVGEEVRAAFETRFSYAAGLFEAERLDLWEANRRQLLDAGVPVDRMTVVGACTACARTALGERRFFSHRAEKGMTGRMMSVIGVAP